MPPASDVPGIHPSDLFLPQQPGYNDVALYDASIREWAEVAALPIEVD